MSGGFEIELARSGRVLLVPADKRVIDVLWEAGVEVPVSCEQGICGTCVTVVVSGLPEHNDSFLTNDEHHANDRFTPCCSRSLSPRLVIDL
jgi:vanillate O-demethylase ferredoxin subunit